MQPSGRTASVEEHPRLAVVTGASSGIGAEFARQLAQRGDALLLIARRRQRLEELAAQLAVRHATPVEWLVADLGLPADVERVAARLHELRVELLVNAAGFAVAQPFFATELSTQQNMIEVHLGASVALTHAVLPGMIARDRGSIISVSSLAAFIAVPGNAVYGATKVFLHHFTRGLELDLARRASRVRVQVLCPGFTRTEFHAAMPDEAARIPPWLWMSAEEVVAASLRGLERDQLVVIPGWRNRVLVGVLGLVPAGVKRRLGIRQARRAGPPRAALGPHDGGPSALASS